MNYLVAVSGGVDSVVLLDMLAKNAAKDMGIKLIVAHVDHGIRQVSGEDARFVELLAKKYQLPFVSTQLHLGEKASEERAREARYEFLFAEAAKHKAVVVTAHHADDVVETVALNLERGTGWRGLAVLARQDIYRPLLPLPKSALYSYALANHLEWAEDETNRLDTYQRNRIRHRLAGADAIYEQIAALRAIQLQLSRDITKESEKLAQRHAGSRHFLSLLDEPVAIELLGTMILMQTGARPMRPQLSRALHMIKTAKPGATFQLGQGISLVFTLRKYHVSVV